MDKFSLYLMRLDDDDVREEHHLGNSLVTSTTIII